MGVSYWAPLYCDFEAFLMTEALDRYDKLLTSCKIIWDSFELVEQAGSRWALLEHELCFLQAGSMNCVDEQYVVNLGDGKNLRKG